MIQNPDALCAQIHQAFPQAETSLLVDRRTGQTCLHVLEVWSRREALLYASDQWPDACRAWQAGQTHYRGPAGGAAS